MMIVDDSAVIRNRIARLTSSKALLNLEIIGMASDGVQALKIANDKRPDVVTMDLTMPEMDGEACIKALSGLLPDCRILVVSALADKATALRAIKRGAHGFIHKPFRDDELCHALQELME